MRLLLIPEEEFFTRLEDLLRSQNQIPSLPNSNGSNEEVLTINQLSNFLNVSKKTINEWKKNGLLTSYRLGGRVFFKKSEILDSLKESDFGICRKGVSK